MDANFWRLLLDLVILLGAALVLGVVCERLRQSAIVGFMLAGVVVGPHGFEAIRNEAMVETIAELGVALLMFTIGLEFSWTRLKQFGLSAAFCGGAQILLTMFVAAAIWLGLGSGPATAVTIGALVSLSSTEVVMPALQQRAEIDSPHGRFSLGVLLVQDAAVVPLVLLVGALGSGGGVGQTLVGMGKSIAIVIGFVVVCLGLSKLALPWVLRILTGTGNREMPILIAVVSAVGAAVAAFKLGLSPALGAFIVAIFLGESVLATQLRGDIGAIKTLFVTLFFASIGMFANPLWIVSHLPVVIAALAVLVVGKAMIVYPIALANRLPHRFAAASAMALAQVGVFSFVLLQIASDPVLGGRSAPANQTGPGQSEKSKRQQEGPGRRGTDGQGAEGQEAEAGDVETAPHANAQLASQSDAANHAQRGGAANPPQHADTASVTLIGPDLRPLLVSIIILSIFLTPYLVRLAPSAGRRWERLLRRWGLARRMQADADVMNRAAWRENHVIVVGFGPAGREVAQALGQDQAPVVVVDLNSQSVLEARQRRLHAVVGDASNTELLEHLALPAARALVVTVPDHRLAQQIIAQARSLCPGLRVIARARYQGYVELLHNAGAETVVDDEGAVGERMKQSVRQVLGPSV